MSNIQIMLSNSKLKNPPTKEALITIAFSHPLGIKSEITCNDVNDAQSITLHKTMSYLQQFLNPTLLSSITLGKATDDEVVVYRKSNNGFYNVVIDTEGDVMVSFSGYTERGWRKFYEQDEFIPASHINDFFSI